ncbi:methyltransferase family protein [Silicimonas algicola]|uniref:Methyltransferase family protein n=2 Tax=Silicimonas algicola TaxID=1826607 RepID=A0A316GEB8_9RHOB|nr:class I SAM-dependent methyltransferase [Silicimonas algicola]PWK59042.1 methyltransferase family protein [Silicimonas algicola]
MTSGEGEVVWHADFGPAMPKQNWIPAPRFLLRRDRIRRHLRDVAPCRVIDIGCGPASILSELAVRGFDAVGVDRSIDALGLARNLISAERPVTLEPKLRPEWKESFDLLLSFEVIEHLEDDVGAMRDWAAYLRPGGRLLLSTPAHPDRWNAADEWAGHVRRYERDGLIRAVTDAGFTVETVECYGFPLANVMEVLRARAYGKVLERKRRTAASAEALTSESGSDRSVESRYWSILSSKPVVLLMKAMCQLQRPFLRTDLGNGYLALARKD